MRSLLNSFMFIEMSWDLLAPSTHIAFDCLIRVYINLTPCSLSSDGDVVWSCRNKQNRGFCLFLSCFFAMENLKWRELCGCFSVRGRTFPWFGENISSLLSEQRLPQYFWVAMVAESIFILAFFVLSRFLLLPGGRIQVPACTGSEWHLVLSLLVPSAGDCRAYSRALQCRSWDVTRLNKMPVERREQFFPGTSFAVTSPFLLLVAVWGYPMSSDFSLQISHCFHSLLSKTHQQRQIACYPIKVVVHKEKP